MKNLIFVFAFVFAIQTVGFSQNKINTDDLIGYWQPNVESVQVFFWKDSNGKLLMQGISGTSGQPLDTISINIKEDKLITRTIFMPNHWVTECKYSFKDKNTLICEVNGDGEGILVFTKVK